MRPQFEIRPAETADIAAIAEIYAESVVNGVASYELEPPDAGEMQNRFEHIRNGGYPFLIARAGESAIGYCYAAPFRTRPAYRFLVEDSVYLHPQWRRRGVGSQLLARLVQDCEELGYRQMIAVIGGASAPSIELHRRHGFRVCGSLEASGYKFGRWLDTVFMQRALGEGKLSLPSD